jgi:hypothetical protein
LDDRVFDSSHALNLSVRSRRLAFIVPDSNHPVNGFRYGTFTGIL